MDRVVLAWSGGKDAAYALYELQQSGVDVQALVTHFMKDIERSKTHRVRYDLYRQQTRRLGVPFRELWFQQSPSNDDHESVVRTELRGSARRGADHVAYADLHLADVRAYREGLIEDLPIEGTWPLWGRDTDALAREIVDAGFQATTVAVDGDALGPEYAGRTYDHAFLDDLPNGVDPCGEGGEFHTFVHDGPIFDDWLSVTTGETTTRTFDHGEDRAVHYCDLRLADGNIPE
jgi:uncharacterized protein (TIGR00290 family)